MTSGDSEHGIQEGEAQLMMGRMLHVLQDLTQFVSRISDLVKHTVQQLASLYSPEGCVTIASVCLWDVHFTVLNFVLQDVACYQLPRNSFASKYVVMIVMSKCYCASECLCSQFSYAVEISFPPILLLSPKGDNYL